MSNTPQSVDRALRILLSFEEEDQDASVAEIASQLGVHKSTASRLTATLERHNLLERAPESGRFRLGPELVRLGLLALARGGLLEVAHRPMSRLAAKTKETVTLSIFDGGSATTVAQIDTPHVVGTRTWIGRGTPLHAASDGKVLVAFGCAPMPAGPLAALTSRTKTSRAQLEAELAEVRENGWAQALGELEEGLHGIAAPVLDASGRCQAALSVSGPAYRITTDRIRLIARACVESATEIGSRLPGSTNGATREVAVDGEK
jgi:DNA-binding IclR family transcriptional regulator